MIIRRIRSAHHRLNEESFAAGVPEGMNEKEWSEMLRARQDFKARKTALYAKVEAVKENEDEIRQYLYWLSSEEVAHSILEAFWTMMHPADMFWRVVLEQWPRCDCAWYNTPGLRSLFQHYKRKAGGDVRQFMDDEDKAFFDSLPELVTVYRGANVDRLKGLSWTTEHKVAATFARGHRGMKNAKPVIAHARVRKSSIFFVNTGRNESEVVCNPRRAFLSEIYRP